MKIGVFDPVGVLQAINRMLEYGEEVGMKKLRMALLPYGDDQPRTDMETGVIYVPSPNAGGNEEDLTRWLGYVWHEAGHHHPHQRHLFVQLQAQGISLGSRLGLIVNAIDDVWQERITSNKYGAAASVLDATQAYHCRDGATIIATGNPDPEAVQITGLMYRCRAHWQPNLSKEEPEFSKLWDSSKWDEYIPQINGLYTLDSEGAAKECIRIARELFEEMTGEDSDSEDAKGKPTEDESQTSEDEGDDDGKRKSRSKSSKSEENGEENSGVGRVSYKELMGHKHENIDGVCTSPVKIVYDHKPAFNYDPWDKVTVLSGSDLHVSTHMAAKIKSVYDASASVSQRILRLFQSESQTLPLLQQKRGRLTAKHLARIPTGDPRIFSKKINRIDRNTCIHITMDFSGSMGYAEKFEYAVASGTHLTKALDRIGIPTRLTGFNDRRAQCNLYELKGWNERFAHDQIINRASGAVGGSNSDGDILLECYRDIIKQNNKRKILIVLSDGQPASMRSGDSYEHLRMVVKQISSRIEVYGIGILDDSVKHFYPEYKVLDQATDIERCLTDVVKQKIMRKV